MKGSKVSKLLKLKEWVTVPDAARHLSITLGEEVSEADILRLALDGRMVLSVNFVNDAVVRPVKIFFSEEEFRTALRQSAGDKGLSVSGMELADGRYVIPDHGEVDFVSGVLDLPMIGAEALAVEARCQGLTGGPKVVQIGDAFVQARTGELWELVLHFERIEKLPKEEQERLADMGYLSKGEMTKHWGHPGNFFSSGTLPEDAVLVVRTEELADFQSKLADEPSNKRASDEPSTRERRTLLTIIAALCNDAEYDYTKAAKTAGMIQSMADKMGVSIGETTIEGHLKKIPNALGTRMK